MNFNLTIQEAIEAMKAGKYCICERDKKTVFKCNEKGEFISSAFIFSLDSWSHDYNQLPIQSVISKWAIYEEPKEEKKGLYTKEAGTMGTKYFIHFDDTGCLIGDFMFAFKKENEYIQWKNSLDTFMRLKSHRLAVPAIDDDAQYLIVNTWKNYKWNICVDSFICLRKKVDSLSCCFNSAEDAQTAIEEIGKLNLLNMFKTFQGIYK